MAAVVAMSAAAALVRSRSAESAKKRLRLAWRSVDPYDGASVEAFTEAAVRVMRSAQTATARAAAAGQVRQLKALGVDVKVSPSNPLDVRSPKVDISGGSVDLQHAAADVSYSDARVKVSVSEASTQQVFNRPAREYRYQKSQGAPDSDAAAAALDRMDGLIDDNLMLAQRLAEAEALAAAQDLDGRVIGYRRVLHPELSKGGSCGLCIAASDRVYKVRELKPIHGNCECTVAAVTRDFDPGDVANTRDLAALYSDAQGNTNPELKRTRYQVDEHGELAAVLVPAAKYKSRADRAKDRAAKRTKTSV